MIYANNLSFLLFFLLSQVNVKNVKNYMNFLISEWKPPLEKRTKQISSAGRRLGPPKERIKASV